MNFKNPIFSQIALIPSWSSNNLLLLLILISMNEFSVIPNNGIYGINSCKINGFWWGPHICNWSLDWLIDRFDYDTWLIYPALWPARYKLFLNCALTLLLIAHGGSLPGYVPIFPLIVVYACPDSHMCMIYYGHSLIYSSIAMIASILLVETWL